MRVLPFVSAIPLLAGGDSTCHSSDGKETFLCDDIQLYITTYLKEDHNDHFYISGDSDGKGLHVVDKQVRTQMRKKGDKYYVVDQNGRYMEAQPGDLHVTLTNRGDANAEWSLKYDPGSPTRFNIFTDVNGATDDTVSSENSVRNSRRRKTPGKNYLSYSDRGTDLKLLKEGDTGGRDWWFIDPAYCAVIDSDKVLGRWQHIKQIIHSGKETEKHGYDLTIKADFHGEFSAKVKAVMKGGFNVGFAKKKAKLKAKLSVDVVADIDADLHVYKETDYEVTWKDEDVGKHLWQFVVDMTDQGSGDCGKTITLKTHDFRLTPGDADKDVPCCIPIGFHGDSWDTCTSTDTLIPGNSVCKVKSQEEFTV